MERDSIRVDGTLGMWAGYNARVSSDDLKPEQARQLMETVGRQLRFLNRLCQRMDRVRFPPDDSLRQAAWTARNAMQHLYMTCHYASCTHGVGRPAQQLEQ
jgi:hypothetical protein